ncbi:Fungal specific transcription factor domain [Teratosphaeria destructans]|uniref:Fungal specific transcription factor domain n=1 Tax=Teratosphaeria destructans TaxID=418781 RepID=A0A9W7SQ78_9PEZI|nr:Fungal specific transcription factor domain [Teratosphaeria destructans]
MPTFPAKLPSAPMPLQTQSDSTDRARAYKSRNKRPCDFCRYKKAACHLDHAPPCELCIRYNKECTFVESPAKRRRPNEQSGNHALKDVSKSSSLSNGVFEMHMSQPPDTPFMNGGVNAADLHNDFMAWENGMPTPFPLPSMEIGPADFGPFDPALYHEPTMTFEPLEPFSASTTETETGNCRSTNGHGHQSSIETSPSTHSATLPANLHLPFDTTSGEPSLDNQASSNAQIVGNTGEQDPYLLSRYRYDAYNEASFSSIRMRKMNSPEAGSNDIPVFFTIAHNALASKAQPVERSETVDRFRDELESMVSDEVGRRLIRLFYRYVQPYFPLSTREGRQERDEDGIRDLSSIPTCILAAMYGHAIPFYAWDEKLCVEVYTPPDADALFKIAWQAVQVTFHTPNLATLQTLLLLVQRRPTNKHVSDTPMKWTMMTTAVSIAQALGLNRDPTEWPLPAWEIKVRKRLAWATWVQDKWLSLNFGRSSHIQADDWDVPPLTEDDFSDWDREDPEGFGGLHFIKLCRLTMIVDDMLRNLFSLRATKRLQSSLDATLDVAKPLRIRLTEWHQSLPIGLLPQPLALVASPDSGIATGRGRSQSLQFGGSAKHDLNGHGSLHLAYITAKIELFRAMLRPKAVDGSSAAISALRTGALAVGKEILEFVENLTAHELEAFWASYSRTNFTIASSFMILLFVTAPSATDARECLQLLTSWRSLLRIKSRSCDLLNLALLRLDGIFVAGMEKLIELSPAAQQAWDDNGSGTGDKRAREP